MRYYYTKPTIYSYYYGEIYFCNHLIYDACTLYKIDGKGLALIQQRFDKSTKSTYWTEIDPWLVDQIYINPNFKDYFNKQADVAKNGLYPTVTVRQAMHALKMKPLKKEKWETVFDRKNI